MEAYTGMGQELYYKENKVKYAIKAVKDNKVTYSRLSSQSRINGYHRQSRQSKESR